jgi:hypothetical protein
LDVYDLSLISPIKVLCSQQLATARRLPLQISGHFLAPTELVNRSPTWHLACKFECWPKMRRGIMKSKSAKLVLVAISFLFASALSAQHMKTHYDRSANFAQYKTYSWEQIKTREPLDVDRIKSAVNAALAAKGWTRVESGGDVWIEAIEGGWRWRGFGAFGPTTDTYEERTLTVELFDTKTKKLLWRGSSTDRLSNSSDKNTKNLDKGVEKLFKKFPLSSSKQ